MKFQTTHYLRLAAVLAVGLATGAQVRADNAESPTLIQVNSYQIGTTRARLFFSDNTTLDLNADGLAVCNAVPLDKDIKLTTTTGKTYIFSSADFQTQLQKGPKLNYVSSTKSWGSFFKGAAQVVNTYQCSKGSTLSCAAVAMG